MDSAAIFFDNEKVYDKVNREKTLKQLENMGIQEKIMELIRELIGEIGEFHRERCLV